ncbi:uncharacterized protein DUF4249 [Balneicella halophila]|uniref:Uncharacterized protein DUF4249 n=1 Tax=Balneicella halophila TaxID=1537566 RepID=A0A7L4USV0_BALHA|nr:DUF4249 domain-containing protein [Balneicella halophila]PVX52327.1 uncharacterized protein DUF4249 [Balneicella halophila]
MKKYIILLSCVIIFFSCEEVVDIDLKEGKKELVVEASIDWIQGTNGAVQTIVLSQTSAYFEDEYPKVSGATVRVKDTDNEVYIFKEEDKGVYICRTFQPEYEKVYQLNIEYQGITYRSIDTLRSKVKFDKIIQNDDGGITKEDKEVEFYFSNEDTASPQYFLIEARDPYNVIPFYFLLDGDDFQDGKYFVVGGSEDWKSGDELEFKVYHISQNYFNYMSRLLAVAEQYGGKPLTTPDARVQGNIINTLDSKANPLGAFRVTSCLEKKIIIE